MQVLICGVNGRMGHVLVQQAPKYDIAITAGVDPSGGNFTFPVYPSFRMVEEKPDCIIDFSNPAALDELLDYAVSQHIPCVICSTGYSTEQIQKIECASKMVPLFRSANMSLGIAVMRRLVDMATRALQEDFDIEIVEAHHNQKVDAPSGTALMLYEAVEKASKEQVFRKDGRSGMSKREKNEIGMHAIRGGTVAGEHAVCYFGPMERIELRHSAEDRSVFAIGALRAARFLQSKAPGMYNMDDILNFSE